MREPSSDDCVQGLNKAIDSHHAETECLHEVRVIASAMSHLNVKMVCENYAQGKECLRATTDLIHCNFEQVRAGANVCQLSLSVAEACMLCMM